MAYRYFYLNILFRVLLVIVLTAVSTYLLLVKNAYLWGGIIIPIIVILVINLIKYFNRINTWVSFYLSGIENEDASLKVPSGSGNKVVDDVYMNVERIKNLLKQAKLDITTQEYYYKSVINQSATGLFSVNENGRVVNINPAAIKLVGLKEFHHINMLETIDKELPAFILQPISNNHEQSAVFENQYGQKLLFKRSTIISQQKKIRLIAVGDITKELDTREVEAWVKLARTLSHEIMNNIAPITTLSKVISDYFTLNDSPISLSKLDQNTISNTLKGLQVIEERSVGLMNFVENYRKFTKLPAPQLETCNLSEVLESMVLASTSFMEGTGISITKDFSEKVMVDTDKELLSQVVINLLKNACEALIMDDVKDPAISISLNQVNHESRIDISNNGPLIPNEIREQIFIPFFTTKEEGSGIGLSLSKQMMLQMGGDLVLRSGKEETTTFSIILH